MWLEGNLLITHGNSHVFVELLRDFGYSKPGINLFIIWGQGSIDIVQRNGAFEYWEYPLSTMPAKYGIKYNTVYMFWTQGSIHIYIYHIYIYAIIYMIYVHLQLIFTIHDCIPQKDSITLHGLSGSLKSAQRSPWLNKSVLFCGDFKVSFPLKFPE